MLPDVSESHLAKSPNLLPKLALILHLADGERVEGEIELVQAERATEVCGYLERHAQRLYGSVATLPQRLAR